MQKSGTAYVNVFLGLWMIVSAFLWHHGRGSFINALLVGIVVLVTSIVVTWRPRARIVNTGAGVWLVASLFAWPTDAPVTAWNNFFVGAAIALTSLIGPSDADITSTRNLEDEAPSTT